MPTLGAAYAAGISRQLLALQVLTVRIEDAVEHEDGPEFVTQLAAFHRQIEALNLAVARWLRSGEPGAWCMGRRAGSKGKEAA